MPNIRKESSVSGLKVVCFGGGTGLSRLLCGLRNYLILPSKPSSSIKSYFRISDLTAIVGVTDDGGSSGRLREEFGTPPPGDIRNCLVALSQSESLLRRLFQYRFPGQGNLSGHSFGNLFLAALTDITGDFSHAIHYCSQILAIHGKIYPATAENVRLVAVCQGGIEIHGESNITKSPLRKEQMQLNPPDCLPLPETIASLQEADIITIGPGSLLTSLLPNLLVKRLVSKIKSSQAIKIYIANIMEQPGETDEWSVSDCIKMIYRHTGKPIFDAVLINSRPISTEMLSRYRAQGAKPTADNREELQKLGLTVFYKPLAVEEDVVRHDSLRLAQAIGEIYRSFHSSKIS
jgi:uncharacterized cofD-like protein